MSNKLTKILIVDDEPDILEFVQYNLEKEGYQVFTANNGLDAISKIEKNKFDLVLLDVMMPEMDGIEVCRQLRRRKEFDKILIAFLTARREDFTQVRALDMGGDDFIMKPIKPRLLLSRIAALLRRKERTEIEKSIDVLKIGEIEINPERVVVQKGSEIIDLTKKEFELLYLLASKPGRVFTRDEIFSKVWGSDLIVGLRTIDVHIRKLREKIGGQYIKTVKGIGYKIDY